MKRVGSITGFLLAMILSLATFVGFKSVGTTDVYAYGNQEEMVAGVSLPTLQKDHIVKISNSIQSKLQNYGFTVNIFDAQNKADVQVAQINRFIDDGVDVLVVMPIDENSLTEVLAKAEINEIIIIVIGQNHGLYPSAIYVDFDYAGLGEYAAEKFLSSYWNQTENFTVLIFACNNSHGKMYCDGVKGKFAKYLNINYEILWVNGEDEVRAQMQVWLQTHERCLPDAIFNCCDQNAQAVSQALKDAGFEFVAGGMPIYGFKSNCTHHYDSLAELIAEIIQRIRNGETISIGERETFLIDFCHCEDE